MGANVIHGRKLSKTRVRYPDGMERDELLAEEGDSTNNSYSSMARMVEFCAGRGVSENDWPIYYDVWEGNVDLTDVAARCERLRQGLAKLSEAEVADIPCLGWVRAWLLDGEQFAVFE